MQSIRTKILCCQMAHFSKSYCCSTASLQLTRGTTNCCVKLFPLCSPQGVMSRRQHSLSSAALANAQTKTIDVFQPIELISPDLYEKVFFKERKPSLCEKAYLNVTNPTDFVKSKISNALAVEENAR